VAFSRAWDRPTPLVCVPTTYASATTADLWQAGYRMVIFANHGIRASIKAVRQALGDLRRAGSAAAIDAQIASLGDVYDLVDVAGLEADERAYLPAGLTEE
jgi:phosphoenolpyruvate phosphomutase